MARLLDLKKRLSENADAAGALAQLTEFAALITTGVTLTGGVLTIPIILSQASKTASSLSKLATLFLEDHKAGSRTQLNPAERADDIFYVFAQRSYMEAVTKLADKLPARRAKVDKVQHTSIVLRIESAIVKPDRAEASFQFGWTSNSGPLQLFDSYKGWMGTILVAAGIKEEIATKWLQDVEQLARKNLFRELVARGEDRQWMVHYQLLSTTTTILDVLRGFIPSNIGPTDAIWDKYLDKLVERPKLAIWGEETEHVSISQLFVEPAYGYSRFSINGASTPGNLAGSVSIKKFLVGLLSDRRPSTELTFVMGGPGSGKTSLMEVFCAEVAASRQLSLILVPAKRLNPNRPLFAEIQSFLAGNGFASIAESLATTNNVVIVIDGFDELAHATL
ncbi:MAG TPA: hypothetical protein VFJ16_12620, partial [Longimicrobium sp.]|nr:hypothetical protein [Longimicrobium sp.]